MTKEQQKIITELVEKHSLKGELNTEAFLKELFELAGYKTK